MSNNRGIGTADKNPFSIRKDVMPISYGFPVFCIKLVYMLIVMPSLHPPEKLFE